MRPIILHGHSRPVAHVTFNQEGDLLFSCGLDKKVMLWRAETGERIGTYDGHTGAVRRLSVTYNSSRLATAGADESVRIWDVSSGRELSCTKQQTTVRSVDWDASGSSLLTVTDPLRGHDAHVFVSRWDESAAALRPLTDVARYLPEKLRLTHAAFGPLNKYIAVSAEDGSMHFYDPEAQKIIVCCFFLSFLLFPKSQAHPSEKNTDCIQGTQPDDRPIRIRSIRASFHHSIEGWIGQALRFEDIQAPEDLRDGSPDQLCCDIATEGRGAPRRRAGGTRRDDDVG